MEVIISYNH